MNWTASNTAREILKLFQDIVATEHITVLMSSDDPLVDKYTDEVVLLRDSQISPRKKLHTQVGVENKVNVIRGVSRYVGLRTVSNQAK